MKESVKKELVGTVKWVIPILAIIIVYKFFDNFAYFVGILAKIGSILTPFVVGFVIAYFLNRPATKIESIIKRTKFVKWSRAIAVILVYTVFLTVIYLALRLLIPTLYKGVLDFISVLPQYAKNLMELINRAEYLRELELTARLPEIIEKFISSVKLADISLYLKQIVNIGAVLLNVFLSIVVSAYMVLERDSLVAFIRRTSALFISERKIEAIAGYLHESDHVVYRYFVGQFSDCLIVSTFSAIGLWLLGAPYPLILGFTFGMFNIIPYFGPIISGFFVILIIFISDIQNNFMLSVWCAVFLLVLQQIDANLINPKILGNALDMSPFWVIFAVTLFSGLFGFVGMLIGVPCIGIIRLLYRDIIAFKASSRAT